MASSSPAHMLSNPHLPLHLRELQQRPLHQSPWTHHTGAGDACRSLLSGSLGTYLGIGGFGAAVRSHGLAPRQVDPHAVFAAGCVLRALSGAMPPCTAIWQVNALAVAQGATLPRLAYPSASASSACSTSDARRPSTSPWAPRARVHRCTPRVRGARRAMPVHGAGFDATAACAVPRRVGARRVRRQDAGRGG